MEVRKGHLRWQVGIGGRLSREGPLSRGNSPLQGHRALKGSACLRHGDCARALETWDREERDEAGKEAGTGRRGAHSQGWYKVRQVRHLRH